MNDADKRRIMGEYAAIELQAREMQRRAREGLDEAVQPNADEWTRADFLALQAAIPREAREARAAIAAWTKAMYESVNEQEAAKLRAARTALSVLLRGKLGPVRKTMDPPEAAIELTADLIAADWLADERT